MRCASKDNTLASMVLLSVCATRRSVRAAMYTYLSNVSRGMDDSVGPVTCTQQATRSVTWPSYSLHPGPVSHLTLSGCSCATATRPCYYVGRQTAHAAKSGHCQYWQGAWACCMSAQAYNCLGNTSRPAILCDLPCSPTDSMTLYAPSLVIKSSPDVATSRRPTVNRRGGN